LLDLSSLHVIEAMRRGDQEAQDECSHGRHEAHDQLNRILRRIVTMLYWLEALHSHAEERAAGDENKNGSCLTV
jgi:hypothetical protein